VEPVVKRYGRGRLIAGELITVKSASAGADVVRVRDDRSQSAPGERAAVDNINNNGGIGGRPLKDIVCQVDGTPEKNISCANRFAREKVAAVVDGFDFGAGAVLPILHSAGIPLTGPAAFTPQGATDTKGSFYFGPSQATFSIGPLIAFKDQDYKKVAFAQIDVPSTHSYFEGALIPAAKGLGLQFSPVYYPPASPNFQTIASALASAKPDVAGAAGLTDEEQCTGLVQDLRNIAFSKTIFAGFCTQFLKLGAAKVGSAEMYSSVWLPEMTKYAPAEVQKQLDTAVKDLASVPDNKRGYYTYATYASVLTLARVLETVKGTVDGASVTAALEATKDMPAVLGPPITCDHTVQPGTSTCVSGLIVAKAQADGSLQPLGGGFQAVPKALLPKPPGK
jgi:branched-chain amino acid transport system substrate-binding protein